MDRLDLVKQALARQPTLEASPLPGLTSPFPTQKPMIYFPGLETRVIHDNQMFPWLRAYENAFSAIKRELQEMLKQRTGFTRIFENYTEGEWAACFFSVYGRRVKENCERCPEIQKLLNLMPDQFGLFYFSALAPGTRILPHCGVTNAKLRCHLPLIVPPGCGLRISNQTVTWEEGKCIVLDDSFEHEAWNSSSVPRFNLLFDFFHPNLTPKEIEFLVTLQRSSQGDAHSDSLLANKPGNVDWVYAGA